MARVNIDYDGVNVPAESGARLLDALLDAGIDHRHICGGHGFCTSCRVEVIAGAGGLSPVSMLERERLGAVAGTIRLACQTFVADDVEIRPARALSARFSLRDE